MTRSGFIAFTREEARDNLGVCVRRGNYQDDLIVTLIAR